MAKKKPDPKTVPALVMVGVRMTPQDQTRLRVVASRAGKSMAEYAREVLLRAVTKAEGK